MFPGPPKWWLNFGADRTRPSHRRALSRKCRARQECPLRVAGSFGRGRTGARNRGRSAQRQVRPRPARPRWFPTVRHRMRPSMSRAAGSPTGPRPRHPSGRRRPRRPRPWPPVGGLSEQQQCTQPGDDGDDHQRKCPAVSPSKRYSASPCEHQDADRGGRPGDDGGDDGTTAEVLDHVVVRDRPASQTRKTAARYAATQTARMPPITEVGLTQLPHGSPESPPVGTRPEAMAPRTSPQ